MLKDLCDRALAVVAAALPEAEAGPAWPGAVRQYPLDRPAVSVTLSAAEAAGYDALSGGDATGGSRWQAELLFELAVPGTYGAAALWPLFDRLAGALLAPGTGLGGHFAIGAAAYDRERDCFAAEGRLTCSAGETVPPAGEAFDRFEVTAGIE